MMNIYGCKISYYTGKLEAYLRYRSIAYKNLPTVGNEEKLIEGAGVVQMPVVELDDGRWLTDTTPTIAWLETQQSAPTIFPGDPVLNFIALLIEDYADEWLWRSAMHYRWSYLASREYAALAIYEDLVQDNPNRFVPKFLAIPMIKRRQLGGFVKGDGVNADTKDHVDRTYLTALDRLEAIFQQRPFILGDAPTIADFGLMAPMFRHFSMDPYPAEIMRERAPAVYEWVARMWNVKATDKAPNLIDGVDDVLADFLTEICETHLAQLRQNAEAFGAAKSRYDQDIQGCHYTGVPASRYRVWCLEKLRRHGAELDDQSRKTLAAKLTSPEAAILWDEATFAPSNYDAERLAPFNKAINVFSGGVPPR